MHIHGVPSTLEAAFASADTLGYDRIVLLGDLLYNETRFQTYFGVVGAHPPALTADELLR